MLLAGENVWWYFLIVIATLDATYEKGVLKLSHPLPLKDKAEVVVTVQSKIDASDENERKTWLQLSEENLTRTWDNTADDVFNELRDR